MLRNTLQNEIFLYNFYPADTEGKVETVQD